MVKFSKNFLLRRKIAEPADSNVEILSPSDWQGKVSRMPIADIPVGMRVRNAAEQTGSIVGGAVAGFTAGVAKQTISPIIAPITKGTGNAVRGTVSFLKKVLLGIFIIGVAIIGLFALLIVYAPKK